MHSSGIGPPLWSDSVPPHWASRRWKCRTALRRGGRNSSPARLAHCDSSSGRLSVWEEHLLGALDSQRLQCFTNCCERQVAHLPPELRETRNGNGCRGGLRHQIRQSLHEEFSIRCIERLR